MEKKKTIGLKKLLLLLIFLGGCTSTDIKGTEKQTGSIKNKNKTKVVVLNISKLRATYKKIQTKTKKLTNTLKILSAKIDRSIEEYPLTREQDGIVERAPSSEKPYHFNSPEYIRHGKGLQTQSIDQQSEDKKLQLMLLIKEKEEYLDKIQLPIMEKNIKECIESSEELIKLSKSELKVLGEIYLKVFREVSKGKVVAKNTKGKLISKNKIPLNLYINGYGRTIRYLNYNKEGFQKLQFKLTSLRGVK